MLKVSPKEIALLCILDMIDELPEAAHLINNVNHTYGTEGIHQNYKLTEKDNDILVGAFWEQKEIVRKMYEAAVEERKAEKK